MTQILRMSNLYAPTLKEDPSDADIDSARLLLRAGMLRKAASGLYTFLPLGFRVLKKIENIVREEMDASGAQEILMPVLQPAELWEESGRLNDYGPELMRLVDRHDREFCLGPTHEELITALVRNELRSAKRTHEKIEAACGVIMLVSTIVALSWLFLGPSFAGTTWDAIGSGRQAADSIVGYFWLPWPIGGILCGIVSILMKAFGRDR